MKTKVMDFVKMFDEKIPDATPETVKGTIHSIGNDAKDTCMCAIATAICAYKTIEDSAMLGLMISKTTVKKAYEGLHNAYYEKPAMMVWR